MNRTILITGCNGFLGSAASATFLATEDRVFGLDLFGEPAPMMSFARVGISRESISLFGVDFDFILHFAGTGTVRAVAADVDRARRDTIDTTVGVLDYLRTHPSCKMICMSSAAVYGNRGGVLSEDSPREPISEYGRLKVCVEDLCREAHERDGCKINVIRPFSVYGKGMRKQLLWDFSSRVHQAIQDRSPSITCYGTGEEKRDFVNVDDVIRLVAFLMSANLDWTVLNCGTGVATSTEKVFSSICAEMGYEGKLVYDGRTRAGDPLTLLADVTRLHSVGFIPIKRFEDGVAKYVQWFLTQVRSS